MKLLKKHPVFFYFLGTFLISWSGVFLVTGSTILSFSKPSEDKIGLLFPAMVSGTTISGLFFTFITNGREGVRKLLSGFLKFRSNILWYLAALLLAPALFLFINSALSFINPDFSPAILHTDGKFTLVAMSLAGGLVAGIFEEIGWTGFALPELRKRYGFITTGLILGLIWGLWHLPLFIPGDPSGKIHFALYLPAILFTHLPAFRILMVRVYDHTESLFLAIIMHTSLTAGTLTLQPHTGSGPAILIQDALFMTIAGIMVLLAVKLDPWPPKKKDGTS